VVNDARDMLNSHLVWEVQHVGRNANGDAHPLAKMALTGKMIVCGGMFFLFLARSVIVSVTLVFA
jgi:hypothetical protein